MKKTIILLLSIASLVHAQNQAIPQVKRIASGTKYTCMALDPTNKLWVGTSKDGLWVSQIDTLDGTISGLSRFSSDIFNTYNLQSIAIASNGASSRIFVGHNGLGSGSAGSGGITEFSEGDSKGKRYATELDPIYARGLGMRPSKNDGVPTRNCKALAVDKYGSIWSAHGYHDMVVSGSTITYPYGPFFPPVTVGISGYFLTPGGVGFLQAGKTIFDNVANGALGYGAYTINPPANKTSGTRMCYSVASGPNETWVGGAYYEVDGGGYQITAIHRFDHNGAYIGSFNGNNTPTLPMTTAFGSPIPMSIHFRKNGDAWVGFNRNMGFAVYRDAIYTTARWEYVNALSSYNAATGTNEPSKLLPSGISINVNAPHTIASSGQRVYIGTTTGLLVYKGSGAYTQDSSYTLITTAEGLSSNNIKEVVANNKYIYVVTDAGIDQIYLPGDVEVLHIRDKSKPHDNTGNQNYVAVGTLINKNDMQITFSDGDLPLIAADGSKSTVFRYYTNDFDAFYNSQKYVYGINADYNSQDTAQFGKFRLRPEADYEDASKSYVDLIYTHPSYIDPSKIRGNEAVYRFSIGNKINWATEFQHDIKFSLPPVLLIHGVWTEKNSLNKIKGKLLENGYKDFQILRAWRNGMAEEMSYQLENKKIVPTYINTLLEIAATNGMSAGKANVIVHSRGGLYTRAYIEELYGVTYNDDVNSLITLNTPHSGSQLANLVLDERVLPIINEPVGDVLSAAYKFIMGEDNLKREGARQLMVDQGFIKDLNEPAKLTALKNRKVPIHIVATNAELCNLTTSICEVDVFDLPVRAPKLKLALMILSAISHDVPKNMDAFLKHLFNDEANDLIVPNSSMEAGVSLQYMSKMPDKNIAHIDMLGALNMPGVTGSDDVLTKIVELLKENMHNTSSSFTKNGVNPPQLTYEFLSWLKPQPALPQGRMAATAAPFKIKHDGGLVKEGDTLRYQVATSDEDYVFISYEHQYLNLDSVYIQDKTITDTLTAFKFRVPDNFYGNMLVIAFGLKDGNLTAVDTLIVPVGLKSNVQLTGLRFEGEKQRSVIQNQRFNFTLMGTFTDSLERVVNTLPGVKFIIEDTVLLKQKGPHTIYAKTVTTGRSTFAATYSTFIDQMEVSIGANDFLKKTILTQLRASKKADHIALKWITDQEYKTQRFVVESSTDGISFDSLSAVSGKGTTYDVQHYAYSDLTTYTAPTVYYRLKIVDSTQSFMYSDTLSVVLDSTITTVSDVDLSMSSDLSIYPNPANQEGFSIEFNAVAEDAQGVISFHEFSGREIYAMKQSVKSGRNLVPNFALPSIPAGIYFLKIKTSTEVLSHKIIVKY